MTAIVGLVYEGRVYLGGDSASARGWTQTLLAEPKVHRTGPYVIGSSGSLRSLQLIRHAFTPPAPTVDLMSFMATTFVDAVRPVLKDGGWATKTNEQEMNTDSMFMVGVNGHLFQVDAAYAVCESTTGYMAIGCGDDFALGAMHATEGQPPKQRIRAALAAAAQFSMGVSAPFNIVSTKAGQ